MKRRAEERAAREAAQATDEPTPGPSGRCSVEFRSLIQIIFHKFHCDTIYNFFFSIFPGEPKKKRGRPKGAGKKVGQPKAKKAKKAAEAAGGADVEPTDAEATARQDGK